MAYAYDGNGDAARSTEITEPPTLTVRGRLDRTSVAALADSLERALRDLPPSALEVDLRPIEEWTTDGVQALAALVRTTPGAVRFRMGAPRR